MSRETSYLVVGNLTLDRHTDREDGKVRHVVGGTAAYSALTARALGCRVAVVTAAGDDLALDDEQAFGGIEIFRQRSARTSTFENTYDEAGQRTQRLLASAGAIQPPGLPGRWSRAQVIHLGPVFGEIDAALAARLAPRAELLAITPQGCMRATEPDGRIVPRPWQDAQAILSCCQVAVLSREDVGGDLELVARYARLVPTLVQTDGWRGATVFHGGERRMLPAPVVREVDPTGAGDIFAAAFFVELARTDDPWRAAELANRVAADSVGRRGLAGVPDRERIASLVGEG